MEEKYIHLQIILFQRLKVYNFPRSTSPSCQLGGCCSIPPSSGEGAHDPPALLQLEGAEASPRLQADRARVLPLGHGPSALMSGACLIAGCQHRWPRPLLSLPVS